MADDLWVNPNGLARSSTGFTDKGRQIGSIAAWIRRLTNPTRLAEAVGNDDGGRRFAQVHLQVTGQLHEGIEAWSTAVRMTGAGVRATARAFGAVEGNATEAATALHRELSGEPAETPRREHKPPR